MMKLTDRATMFEALVEARDADEATEFISRRLNPVKVRPLSGSATLNWHGSYMAMPTVRSWSVDVEHGADIRPLEDFDGYFFYAALRGSVAVELRRDTLEGGGQQALVTDGNCLSLQFSPAHRQIGVFFDRAALVQRLSQLLDAPLRKRLQFVPRLAMASGPVVALTGLVACLNRSCVGSVVETASFTQQRLAATMIDLALETLPHNFSEELRVKPKIIAPRHVKRAVDLMHANLDQPIAIDEVARQCGVSLRALQYGFKHFLGSSPGDYLRSCRLEAVRRDVEANPELPLSEVAKRWGFGNIGRFNHQFKMRFGESVAGLRARLRERSSPE